jgi:hypothetical protein
MTKKLLSSQAIYQCERLHDALRLRSMTTVEIRCDLDIMMPATRVFELKEKGINIGTVIEPAETVNGNIHKVARYVLLSGESVDEFEAQAKHNCN